MLQLKNLCAFCFILQARVRCSEINEKPGTRAKRSVKLAALLIIFNALLH